MKVEIDKGTITLIYKEYLDIEGKKVQSYDKQTFNKLKAKYEQSKTEFPAASNILVDAKEGRAQIVYDEKDPNTIKITILAGIELPEADLLPAGAQPDAAPLPAGSQPKPSSNYLEVVTYILHELVKEDVLDLHPEIAAKILSTITGIPREQTLKFFNPNKEISRNPPSNINLGDVKRDKKHQ